MQRQEVIRENEVVRAVEKVYVYIIQSVTGWCYCGLTKDIVRRLIEHNRGESKSTAKYRPYYLKWMYETESRLIAREMEKRIKRFGVKRFLLSSKYNGSRQMVEGKIESIMNEYKHRV